MNRIIDVNSPISADMMSAGAIYDVLCMRDQKSTNFTSDELNQFFQFNLIQFSLFSVQDTILITV